MLWSVRRPDPLSTVNDRLDKDVLPRVWGIRRGEVKNARAAPLPSVIQGQFMNPIHALRRASRAQQRTCAAPHMWRMLANHDPINLRGLPQITSDSTTTLSDRLEECVKKTLTSINKPYMVLVLLQKMFGSDSRNLQRSRIETNERYPNRRRSRSGYISIHLQ
jgi:hypothetical protein